MFSARSIFYASEGEDLTGPRILSYAAYQYPDGGIRYEPSFLPTANIQSGANWYQSTLNNPLVNDETYSFGGEGQTAVCFIQSYNPSTSISAYAVGISQNGGSSYNSVPIPPGVFPFSSQVAYANGVLVFGAINSYPNNIQTSSDLGVTWTPRIIENVFAVGTLRYVNNRWFAFITQPPHFYSTDNAATWTAISNPSGQPNGWSAISDVTYGNSKYLMAGNTNDYVNAGYSTDGVNWTGVNIMSNAYITAVAFGAGKFVAVSNLGNLSYSTDAINWTNIGSVVGGGVPGDYYVAFDGTNFILIGQGSGSGTGSFFNVAYSSDAINWTVVASNAKSISGVQAIITNA